jgi:phage pi2 protein 07
MSSKTKKITTLNEEQNLAVDIEFQEYSVDGKTNVDFGTGNGRMRQRTKDILHVSNELKKLNKKSKAVKFIIDWTGENIVITCPEKNIELNFVLHHSTSLESGNSMLKEMGRYNHEIEYIFSREKELPEPAAAEWLHHPDWKANRDLRQGGFVSYPEITHTQDFVPAFLANYEAVFSAKACANIGQGDPMRGGKILSFLNTYWSQYE